MKKILLPLVVFGGMLISHAQETPVTEISAEELAKRNWFHADFESDSIYGVSTDAAYKFVESKNLKPSPIIVAVIDSGVDIEHEDLKEVLWTNINEIPNNGIDDDNNGYVDDIHGWNFIGGPDGNVDEDTLEITRLVKEGMDLFETPDEFTNQNNKEKYPEKYEEYKKMKIQVEEELAKTNMTLAQIDAQIEGMLDAMNSFGNSYGMDKVISVENLRAFEPENNQAGALKENFLNAVNTEKADGLFGNTPAELIAEIKTEIENDPQRNYYLQRQKNYDVNFDPRPIVGDNYDDKTEKYYGNNDVDGPDSLHGTHVAGIIGAKYSNELGMDGVARHVEIMSVRTVPNGDERDKDVANAIRYAVDNGAKVLNMSFGKAYSPDKELVWDAIRYATEKGVLMVHAAGNDNKDIDTESNYPTNFNEDGQDISDTWLTVGASTRYNDKIKASFSNFGKKGVDIFAPGLEIYSTVPENKYRYLQGTSMAAPVVAGVAAMVWSYYPTLSAPELRELLIESGNVNPDLTEISTQGKVVNALNAVKLADQKVKISRSKARRE
ncbi:S8 family serine peptidase [Flavobacteriaceae bacterium Ap0902]|nr:S8 family serine peptidase [Flavobacteriaceae bacterium Ap0902]